jgi:FkbM family methyltransferase
LWTQCYWQEGGKFSGQQFLSAASIFVEQLDDIFNLDEVVIPLLKMDIQGFECKALDGMTSLLSTVDLIFTEADQALLQGQGCMYCGGND